MFSDRSRCATLDCRSHVLWSSSRSSTIGQHQNMLGHLSVLERHTRSDSKLIFDGTEVRKHSKRD